jgi:hypothetical protein
MAVNERKIGNLIYKILGVLDNYGLMEEDYYLIANDNHLPDKLHDLVKCKDLKEWESKWPVDWDNEFDLFQGELLPAVAVDIMKALKASGLIDIQLRDDASTTAKKEVKYSVQCPYCSRRTKYSEVPDTVECIGCKNKYSVTE